MVIFGAVLNRFIISRKMYVHPYVNKCFGFNNNNEIPTIKCFLLITIILIII